ncbi:MAG: hypothetical protein ABJN26_06250 [Stappiaceae bacterium]
MARAVLQLGETLFAEEWTGAEMYVSSPIRLFLDQSNSNVDDKLKFSVHRAIRTIRAATPFRADKKFTEDEWSEGIAILADQEKQLSAERKRFSDVKETLIDWLVEGKLPWCLRPARGGEFSHSLPAHFWNSELLHPYFTKCGMQQPKGLGFKINMDPPYCYIFVDGQSLDQLHAEISDAAPGNNILLTTDNLIEPSPYLRLLVDLHQRLKISNENQIKADSLNAEIKSEFEKRGLPFSKVLISKMATILRLPESQQGRAKKN